jgi:hypothetical protein
MTNHSKTTLDGANGTDIIGEFAKSASRPFQRRHNPLTGRAESAQRRQRFYLAVAYRPRLSPDNRPMLLRGTDECSINVLWT